MLLINFVKKVYTHYINLGGIMKLRLNVVEMLKSLLSPTKSSELPS